MDLRRMIVTGLLLGTLSAGWGCETRTSDKDIAKESVLVSLADVRQLMLTREEEPEAVLLIDPRSPRAFAEGHLPGARNLRLPEVPEQSTPAPDLQRYRRLVVYGENPGSAVAKAMFKRLLAVGYGGVRFFPGGLHEWTATGYAVETSEPPIDPDAPADLPAGGAGS